MPVEQIGSVTVEVSENYTFGEDALLLARFSTPRDGERACELGTGCGVISLIWCSESMPASVDALDIQPDAAELARRNAKRGGFDALMRVHCLDLRQANSPDFRKTIPAGSMDFTAMNPPYFSAGTGRVSASPAAALARHEGAGCALEDVVRAASAVLRDGGRFALCHRPERLCDVLCTLRNARLEPKRLKFISRAAGVMPWLFLCEAKKGAKPGCDVLN